MKKQIVIILLMAMSAASFGQTTTPSTSFTKSDYLKKSKRQQTAAWITASGGVILFGTGLAIGLRETTETLLGLFETESKSPSAAGAVLFYTGTASILASIPLFIAASGNKRKASEISASFKFESLPTVQRGNFSRTSYPAIALRVSL